MTIPNTLRGLGQENVNIQQLLEAEHNKDDITTEEKKVLQSNTLAPPRTINYAIKMMSAHSSTIKAGGEDSLIFRALDDQVDWTKENEELLSENTLAHDRDIPAKMTYAVGEQLNNYFRAAKYGVPDPSWLDFKDLRKNLTTGQLYVNLPQKITEILNPHKRKREDQRDNSNTDRSKKPLKFDTHENQPIPLKCTLNMHRAVIDYFLSVRHK